MLNDSANGSSHHVLFSQQGAVTHQLFPNFNVVVRVRPVMAPPNRLFHGMQRNVMRMFSLGRNFRRACLDLFSRETPLRSY